MKVISASEVEAFLDEDSCRAVVRQAMTDLSAGRALQPLRQILEIPGSPGLFGVMPGALGEVFGAKLASVFPPELTGGASHQGVLALFDAVGGAPICIIPAGAITALRTAAASAAATEVLARPEATRLCILGTGEQAWTHIAAVCKVRAIARITIWGRSTEKAQALAERASERFGIDASSAADVEEAAAGADIICTTTAASEPILLRKHVAPGAHINLVGSSRAGPAEVDNLLVAESSFFVDHRASALAQGAEFLNAKFSGLIGDDHILGEIGEVFAGELEGRRGAADVTLYKSLGSIVQDLAAGWHVFEQSQRVGFGVETSFE